MNQLAEREMEVRKFATVFLTIGALNFILQETIANKEQGTLMIVVFGSILAIVGASMADEREREQAAARASR